MSPKGKSGGWSAERNARRNARRKRREKRSIERLAKLQQKEKRKENQQENQQEKHHPGNLDISELDYDVGDLYEFYECVDKLGSLVGTDEFASYKQSMIDRVWYLPDYACNAYRDLLGVGYKDPPPRDHPYYIINY
ncbi:hypothetical protein JCM33374_g5483 [Metschnikowia sp. JCM 33374]|nr:hypothetical protein JCM33374_g5483 [Metschnikowia sp. JCM 33374]